MLTACDIAGVLSRAKHVSRNTMESRLVLRIIGSKSCMAISAGVQLQARYQSAHHPGLVDPLLALAAIELRQSDTASWQR